MEKAGSGNIYIGLGATLPHPRHGSPKATLEAALVDLEGRGLQVLRLSPWYRTAPVPASDQPWFVNAVAELATDWPADRLATLDAGGWHSARFQGEPVPTFSDAGRLCVALGLHASVEIKPFAPGGEVSGVVRSVGAGVTDLKVGDEVFGVLETGRDGTYCEKLAVGAAVAAAAIIVVGIEALNEREASSSSTPPEAPGGLRALLARNIRFARLEDAAIPISVIATEVMTGLEAILDRGPAVDALLASSAIPGVLPPVTIDGRPLIDGAIVNGSARTVGMLAGVFRQGTLAHLAAIPLDDKKTYEMLGRGETIGVFQVESAGMRKALEQMKQCIETGEIADRPDLLERFMIDALKAGHRAAEGHRVVGRYVMEPRLAAVRTSHDMPTGW